MSDFEPCTDGGHRVVRNRPGYLCNERGCFWGTDCTICMGQHRKRHRTAAVCVCGAEVHLTRTLRWPHHGDPDSRCKMSGRKFVPAKKELKKMLDGKYWVLFAAGETLGVTTDESRVKELLIGAYKKEVGVADSFKDEDFELRLKFDTYTLMVRGVPRNTFYAMNEREL